MNTRTMWMFVVTALGLFAPGLAMAGEGGACCCHHCGCHDNLQKTCRLVCEEKEIKEPKYSVKCEDFCVPGPSKRCGKECECDCNSWFGHTCKWIWEPTTCAAVHTRKVLVKEEVKKKVPSYKWVVEYQCGGCGHCGAHEKVVDAKTAAQLQPPVPSEMVASPIGTSSRR